MWTYGNGVMREHDEVGILASTPQYRISVSGTSTPNVQYNDFGWDSSLACGESSGAKKLRENGTCGSLSAYQVSENAQGPQNPKSWPTKSEVTIKVDLL
jgi:hypothetical protein